MQLYICRILNHDGSTDTFQLGVFADVSEATRAARSALLVSLSGRSLELLCDGQEILHLNREVAQFRAKLNRPPTQDWTSPPGSAG